MSSPLTQLQSMPDKALYGCLILAAGYPVVTYLIRKWNLIAPKGLQYPPGPSGNAFIGNSDLVASLYDRNTFEVWRKQYGDIVSLNILGTRVIVLNSQDVVHELLEKRSSIYSDRYQQPFMNSLGWTYNFGFMNYGTLWKRHSRLFYQYFNPTVVRKYDDLQLNSSIELLQSLYTTPELFIPHVMHLTAKIIMKIVYDYDVKRADDPFIEVANLALMGVNAAGSPGANLSDFLPLLNWFPYRFYGAQFQKNVKMWRHAAAEAAHVPFNIVKNRIMKGEAEPCMVSSVLADLSSETNSLPDAENVLRETAAIAYVAGAGTTSAALLTIILSLLMYPDIQRKCQEEIDSVVVDRLPTMDDRANLPYLNAFISETQRWRPVLPFGVPHIPSQDDTYGNYFIPKGSLVITNTWDIFRDEKLYGPRVHEFDPTRFLKTGINTPTEQFGYGRRICPGRHLANGTLFIATAMILKIFDIQPTKDENGNVIPVSGTYTTGTTVCAHPFVCSITPRSTASEKLILNTFPDNSQP